MDLVYRWMELNNYHCSVPYNLDLFLKSLSYNDMFGKCRFKVEN